MRIPVRALSISILSIFRLSLSLVHCLPFANLRQGSLSLSHSGLVQDLRTFSLPKLGDD
jgi:hypothetical protein